MGRKLSFEERTQVLIGTNGLISQCKNLLVAHDLKDWQSVIQVLETIIETTESLRKALVKEQNS